MDFRYLIETKNEFNNFLCGILVPHIYHGIRGMLKYSENVSMQIDLKIKKGAKINNPGVIYIFKKTLEGISSLNNHEIDEEYLRIKNNSGCYEWFDNLVRACFKSFVLALTWDPKLSVSKYSDNELYETIQIKDFIHKCYVITCNFFRDNPELFLSKHNKKDIFEIIKTCFDMAIKKSLPYDKIIQEYLEIDFTRNNDNNTKEIANIKNLVYNMINNNKYGGRPNTIMKDSDSENYINIENPDNKQRELDDFINKEKIIENQKNNNITPSLTTITSGGTSGITTGAEQSTTEYSEESSKANKLSETSDELVSEQKGGGDKNVESDSSNSSNSSNLSGRKNISSTVMSRAELKNKEINTILNLSKTSSDTSDNKSNISRQSGSSRHSKNSSSSKHSQKSNKSQNKIEYSKTSSVEEILTTPPPIRKSNLDRINETFQLGGNNKSVRVVMKKNKPVNEKFDQAESYFQNMLKI